MNEVKPEEVVRALDVLDRMDFFQGQRAGRELWNGKPYKVQEQDLADFSQGIATVKKVIEDVSALLREKNTEIERLHRVSAETNDRNFRLLEATKKSCKARTNLAVRETVTAFEEALKALQDPDNPWDTFQVSEEQITQIANSLKEELDETNDR